MTSLGNHKEKGPLSPWIVSALLLLAVCYNVPLAMVNAHVRPVTMTHVAVTELLVLILASAAVLSRGLSKRDEPSAVLAAAFFLVAVLLSFINGGLVAEAFRNIAIIVLFTMIGIRSDERSVRIAFAVLVGLAFAVMLFELVARQSYGALFDPYAYYHNTRGLGERDYSDIGLFPNAMGFEGRFSFGVFNAPRTSSIFLEQTSFANFASVIVVYLVTMWPRLGRAERWFGVTFVVLALLSNNTRMASAYAALSVIGYFVYPRLARYGTLLLPLVMLGLAIFASSLMGPSRNDDFAGRIGLSVYMLSLTDLRASLGARAFESDLFPDSGYSYVLYSSSLAGAIALWLYVALIVPFRGDMQKRCAWALGIFFFMNLLVAGNAVFSIKVAAPLWLLAGLMRSPAFLPMQTRAAIARGVRTAPLRDRTGDAPTAGQTEAFPAGAARRRWSRVIARPTGWRPQ